MPAHIMQETDRAVIRFSYDADLVEQLKVRIPSRFRKWDPADKSWTVSEPWVKTVTALLVKHFGERAVSLDDRRPGAKREPDPEPKGPTAAGRADRLIEQLRTELSREKLARQSAQRDADRFRAMARGSSSSNGHAGDWAAELYRQLPAAMRDPVYKRLLGALHPDANGGSPEAAEMTKRLNGAFRPPKSGR